MNKLARLTGVIILALALSACVLIPQRPEVDTSAERLGEAHVVIRAIAASTEDNLRQGRISPDQAEEVADTLDDAAAVAKEAATVIAAGDDPEQRLSRLESLLQAAERRLQEETGNER